MKTKTLQEKPANSAGQPVVSKRFLRVPFLEDNLPDVELCLRALKQAGFDVRQDMAQTREEFGRP